MQIIIDKLKNAIYYATAILLKYREYGIVDNIYRVEKDLAIYRNRLFILESNCIDYNMCVMCCIDDINPIYNESVIDVCNCFNKTDSISTTTESTTTTTETTTTTTEIIPNCTFGIEIDSEVSESIEVEITNNRSGSSSSVIITPVEHTAAYVFDKKSEPTCELISFSIDIKHYSGYYRRFRLSIQGGFIIVEGQGNNIVHIVVDLFVCCGTTLPIVMTEIEPE